MSQNLYVRMRLPGIDEPSERLTAPLVDSLARYVYAATGADSSAETLELWQYSGPRTQELLIDAVGDVTEGSTDPIQLAADHLPEALGFELVELTPPGPAPTVTFRLVAPTGTYFDEHTRQHNSAFRAYLAFLIENRIAHLVQIIVHNDGADRLVSARVGVYDREAKCLSTDDYAAELADGRFDPATYFDNEVITSSRRLPLSGPWRLGAESRILGRYSTPYLHADRSPYDSYRDTSELQRPTAWYQQAQRTSVREFEALQAGETRPTQREAYHAFNVDPWISFDSEALPDVIAFLPEYYERDPWPAVFGWQPPTITVRSALKSAPGTPPGTTDTVLSSLAHPSTDLPSKTRFSELTKKAAAWLTTDGRLYNSSWYTQADFECRRNGRRQPVLVTDGSAVGDIIALASETYRDGFECLIVTDESRSARRIAEALTQPFWSVTTNRVQLYATTQRLEHDSAWCVFPRILEPLEWWLRADGRIELYGDGDRLTTLPRSSDPAAVVECLPRCRKRDGQYVIRDASGAVIDRTQTEESLNDAWGPLMQPAQPAFLATGLNHCRIFVPDRGGFNTYRHRPDWSPTVDERFTPLQNGPEFAARFLERYTRPAEGNAIDFEAVETRLITWLHSQSDLDLESLDRRSLFFKVSTSDERVCDRQWLYPVTDPGRFD